MTKTSRLPDAGQAPTRGAGIRPVSRVWFEASDTEAFDKMVRLCVTWMQKRSNVTLPSEAINGTNFDISDVIGANPAKAVRIQASDGLLWAARLDFPDKEFPRNWVTELFVEKRLGELARFGAQLTCVSRADTPPYDITRPRVVRDILENLSAEADGWSLNEDATTIDKSAAYTLAELLFNPVRRLPVLVISEDDTGVPRLAPASITKQIAGAAHIIHLTSEASRELTRELGKSMSVFNGAVRLYLPGLSEKNENPYQHPLWIPGVRVFRV